LADAIETMMLNPELAARYGSAGRRYASEMFSTEAFIRNYCSIFRRAIGRSRNGTPEPHRIKQDA